MQEFSNSTADKLASAVVLQCQLSDAAQTVRRAINRGLPFLERLGEQHVSVESLLSKADRLASLRPELLVQHLVGAAAVLSLLTAALQQAVIRTLEIDECSGLSSVSIRFYGADLSSTPAR